MHHSTLHKHFLYSGHLSSIVRLLCTMCWISNTCRSRTWLGDSACPHSSHSLLCAGVYNNGTLIFPLKAGYLLHVSITWIIFSPTVSQNTVCCWHSRRNAFRKRIPWKKLTSIPNGAHSSVTLCNVQTVRICMCVYLFFSFFPFHDELTSSKTRRLEQLQANIWKYKSEDIRWEYWCAKRKKKWNKKRKICVVNCYNLLVRLC